MFFLLFSLCSPAPKAYSMTAVPGLLVRGIYNLERGDYVNLTFNVSRGFLIVSQPNHYYVNIGRDCSPSNCIWYHKTLDASYSNGVYGMGNSPGYAQVLALSSGTFLITIAYITDCQISRATDRDQLFSWIIEPNSSTCFFNTMTTGTITINTLSIGIHQYARLYGTHFRWGFLTAENATRGTSKADAIGAVMLTNTNLTHTFEVYLNMTWEDDWSEAYRYGSFYADKYPNEPSVIVQGQSYQFDSGGCRGTDCPIGASGENSGNTDGIPSKCDGDPVPEDDGGGGGGGGGDDTKSSLGVILLCVAGGLTLVIIVTIVVTLLKAKRRREFEFQTLATIEELPQSQTFDS